uniref:Uncharacterized protein AlNc14C135G7063 n=1 Tax=Albugo laibachii Nc14 TaxID=890382 RepID=F0W6H0_9STRA|nr:conserved hypothetical protein [Albugo laibachii Nc14]CCA21820.1 conserved hypothetical protein [Albugo laibachii Nc14]|eukprot:CCA21820.1 conserved hypothetical protein [Albugo laibachii Nc14]
MLTSVKTLSRRIVIPTSHRRFIGGIKPPSDISTSKVSDIVVGVTLIDYSGNRQYVQGRVGQTLCQACQMNDIDLLKDDSNGGGDVHSAVRSDYYTESLFGEGSVSPTSHVIVSNEWMPRLPRPNDQEQHILDVYVPEEDRSANSRLGTEIILTKDMDGLVVAVPEAPPFETYQYEHEYEDDDEEEESSYAHQR